MVNRKVNTFTMENNSSYQHITTKPQISSLLIVVITINMFIWINQLYVIGVFFAVFSLLVLFRTSGYILDKENKRIKMVSGFSGIKIGTWYKLPEVKYISLLRIHQGHNSNSGSIISNNSSKSFGYQVNLVVRVHREHKAVNLLTTTVNEAKNEGIKLGKYLDLKVFDSTSHKRCWLKNEGSRQASA